MLCAFSFLRSASFALGTPTVESLIPNMDSHGNNNNAWSIKLCFEHSSISQSASWLKYIFGVTYMVLKYITFLK